MNPQLLTFHGLHLPVYSTFLAIGLGAAIWAARRWAIDNNLDRGRMVDFGLLMVIFGLIGAKILHIFADGFLMDYINLCIDPSQVEWHVDRQECHNLNGTWIDETARCHPQTKNCLAWLSPNGFAFYGGFIASALLAVWYVKRHGWPGARLCDMGGWTIMLGLAWGRMGCFLAGCCFGAHSHSHMAVSFPPGSPAARHQWMEGMLPTYRQWSLPVHPTQLYESLAALIIAAVAYLVIRPRKRYDGQVFIFSMVAYAVFRFSVEFIRRDDRGALGGLSTSQIIAIAIVIACVWLANRFKKASSHRIQT